MWATLSFLLNVAAAILVGIGWLLFFFLKFVRSFCTAHGLMFDLLLGITKFKK